MTDVHARMKELDAQFDNEHEVETVKQAFFSSDRKYRYLLIRLWNDSLPKAMCIGLNPSNANEDKDDATIRNLVTVLKENGFGGLYMTNLYGLVTSKPYKLSEHPDPVGTFNDGVIKTTSEACSTIFFCWGNFTQAAWRAKQIVKRFPNALCFGKSRSGAPIHPLAATVWQKSKCFIQPFNK